MKKEKSSVIQRDIACLTGWSGATVSKALRGFSDISQGTIDQIRETAELIGYTYPRKQRGPGRKILGIVYDPDVMDDSEIYYRQLLYDVQTGADRMGYSGLLMSNDGKNGGASYLSIARASMMAGVCVLRADYSREGVRNLLESEIPAVLVNHYYDGRVCVMSDEEENTKMLLEHLKSRGFGRLAYLYRDERRRGAARKNVMIREMEEQDFPGSSVRMIPVREKDGSDPGRFLRALLSHEDLPDGILCAEPEDAWMICMILGCGTMDPETEIPRKLAVAGFDGTAGMPGLSAAGQRRLCAEQVFVGTENLADTALEYLGRLIRYPEAEISRPYYVKGKIRFC